MAEQDPFLEIDNFIRNIDGAKRLDEVRTALHRQIDRFGFENFTYWVLRSTNGSRSSLFLSNYPAEWTRHYIANEFRSSDIIVNYSASVVRPFAWETLKSRYELSAAQRLVFDEGGEVGLKAGGTIPIHGPKDARAIFSVSKNCRACEFQRLFDHHRHELQLVAAYAHEKILQIGLPQPPKVANLTARELEVLTWSAKGKTRLEIGEILHISDETVKRHLSNASSRLQAANKTQAVAIALAQGIIAP